MLSSKQEILSVGQGSAMKRNASRSTAEPFQRSSHYGTPMYDLPHLRYPPRTPSLHAPISVLLVPRHGSVVLRTPFAYSGSHHIMILSPGSYICQCKVHVKAELCEKLRQPFMPQWLPSCIVPTCLGHDSSCCPPMQLWSATTPHPGDAHHGPHLPHHWRGAPRAPSRDWAGPDRPSVAACRLRSVQ